MNTPRTDARLNQVVSNDRGEVSLASIRNLIALCESLELETHSKADALGRALALLGRWAEWARAHGHDVGMLDDTREFLKTQPNHAITND